MSPPTCTFTGRPMVIDSLFQKRSQNLPPSLPQIKLPIVHPIQNPLPPQNETANSLPIWNFSNVLAEWSEQWKSTEMQKIRPPKSLKNEMFIFGLHSTSDDWPSDPSNESWLKCKKRPLSHQKMKCSFLDYVQLLMIGQAIRAMKVNQNAKKAP